MGPLGSQFLNDSSDAVEAGSWDAWRWSFSRGINTHRAVSLRAAAAT
jgi:hypothetical protein